MVNTIVNNTTTPKFSENLGKRFLLLSGVLLGIVALTIFQDFLESKRNGSAFYFNESILFKIVWLLFLPVLALLYKNLKKGTLDSYGKAAVLISSAIAVHLLILPFVAVIFSVLFYQGRYDLYKFFSYSLANDLYKLVLVYTSFVLGYQFFSNLWPNSYISKSKPVLSTIVINNGKENVVVHIADVLLITSATPYIFIHQQNRRYLHSETLKSICSQLDSSVFVRVHKSSVVNISKVSSFKSRLNGDYDLQLVNGDLVRLSRTYAADFKNRFAAAHQLNR